MPGHEPAATVADHRGFELQTLAVLGGVDHLAHHQLPVAEIEHHVGPDRHTGQPGNPRAGLGQVAQDHVVVVILVDQPDLAEDGDPLGAVAGRAAGAEHARSFGQLRQYLVLRDRARENVALHQIRAARLDQFKLVHRLDAFGDGLHAERLGERNDGGDDRRVGIAVLGAAAHEALVDLDLVEMAVLEVTER